MRGRAATMLAAAEGAAAAQCTMDKGQNNWGVNLRKVTGVLSPAACCDACAAADGCHGYTWYPGSAGWCFLKASIAPNQPDPDGGVSGAYGPRGPTPAPTPTPRGALEFRWYDHASTGGASSMPWDMCPFPADGAGTPCPCPAEFPVGQKGCQGCNDYPGGVFQYAQTEPELVVLGLPGLLTSVFVYQRFSEFLVRTFFEQLGMHIRFEWLPGHWASCRAFKFCRGETANATYSYTTCMKRAALHVLQAIRERHKVSRLAMLGHSAGTTAMLELFADEGLPSNWTVERLVFMAPGTFDSAAGVFSDDQKRTLGQRAARDRTRPVAVFGSNDVESVPAARGIAAFWANATGGGGAPFRMLGENPWPGSWEMAHCCVQDGWDDRDQFAVVAPQIFAAFTNHTARDSGTFV